MSWMCSGASNEQLVRNFVASRIVKSRAVEEAMLATDRGIYAQNDPYMDSPQTIGYGQTISAPHMHAYALESLHDHLKPGSKVLDVGCGSGYLSAAMARMVSPNGHVVGVDVVPQLVDYSKRAAEEDGFKPGNELLQFETSDGWNGWAEGGPYDAIHVGAAAPEIPTELLKQLNVGGRMVIPVGRRMGDQSLVQVDRLTGGSGPGAYSERALMGVRYVPLVNQGSAPGGSWWM